MAKLSSDKKYVTVQAGDTLSQIAEDYAGGASNYKTLATYNGIPNPDLIYIGQKIYLSYNKDANKTTSGVLRINHFGVDAWNPNTIFANWTFSKSGTEKFKVTWKYKTPSNLFWYVGSETETSSYTVKYSTYTIPSNATQICCTIKPICKESYKPKWTINGTTSKPETIKELECLTPSAPSVELKDLKLTATLNDIDMDSTHVVFKIIQGDKKDIATSPKIKVTYPVSNGAGYAAWSYNVPAGHDYKVCAQAYRGSTKSEWSGYSSTAGSGPPAPGGITELKALSKTSVYIDWGTASTAESYDIQYTTQQRYFDSSNEVQSMSVESVVSHAEITNLESGQTYFFRVRAVKGSEKSGWTAVKSITIGKKPTAPTTWSSTTSVLVGEPALLYWVHNTEDGSSQVKAELELTINGTTTTQTIVNSTDEDKKDKTSSYSVSTSGYSIGTKILWRVRTCGITGEYGDWSTQRTVDVYAPPTLTLSVTDSSGLLLETLKSFPFYVNAIPGPETQTPLAYTVSIVANEAYETIDYTGEIKMVKAGGEVYSKNYDVKTNLLLELSATSVDLENGIPYTLSCTVSMDSGLTATASQDFTVSWTELEYSPNAEVYIDSMTLTASIRPYCQTEMLYYYIVTESNGVYTKTTTKSEAMFMDGYTNHTTTTGEEVYIGVDVDGNTVYYCEVIETTVISGTTLAVYRREYDGSLVEIAKGLPSSQHITVTDPHPALDYARYRIVSIDDTNGAVSYTDLPGIPIDEPCIVLQWDDEWVAYDNPEGVQPAEPTWAGSLVKLPYNVDVSESTQPDVSLVEYIGRSEPVSYYGTQKGESMTCNAVIDKEDSETLYALRRLAKWMGDVYVREPSGIGYWANVTVSMSQKHLDVTIPVTLNITRVAGGA